VANPFESSAVLSFCPGILGLERGIEQAIGKLRVAAYSEVEGFLIANLLAGMESGLLDPAPVWTDVKTFPAQLFRGKIHGILAGYSCQPFSLAGKREGEDDPRHLWPAIRNVIETVGPVWCYFENVDDHLSMGFDTVYKDLHALGYAVEAGVYTAEEVGAPHERKRLFILALALPYKMAARGRVADLLKSGKAHEREAWLKNGQWGRNGISIGSAELADTEGGQSELYGARNGGQSSGGGSEELDTAGNKTVRKSKGTNPGLIQRSGENNTSAGKELAYTNSSGQQEFGDNGEPDEPCDNRTGHPGSELGNADMLGQQKHGNYGCGIGQTSKQAEWSEIVGTAGPIKSRYPAGQGHFQYDWEPKRTVEPGLGCTFAGYNFREDILRAIGNSVVADCAEVAFIDLLTKHLK
jgi:DNA (cytosine-5)-methyltransferase 1